MWRPVLHLGCRNDLHMVGSILNILMEAVCVLGHAEAGIMILLVDATAKAVILHPGPVHGLTDTCSRPL